MKEIIKSIILFSLPFTLWSNNLQIQNTQLAATDVNNQFAMIALDISWDNSWRDATNRDAAWVFIKYRTVGSTDAWQHATLATSGHSGVAGSSIEVPGDGKGVFIYRSGNGSGNNNFTNIQLRWHYGADGVASSNEVDLKVLGIEMVYVPQGSFYVGDGQTTTAQLYGNFEAGTTGAAFQISSEAPITLGGGGAGSLGNNNAVNQFNSSSGSSILNGSGDDFDDANSQTLPIAFPKGYNAFYCMKYEMTQQQYVDMLNCLTATQQATLTNASAYFYSGSLLSNRHGITNAGGTFTTSLPHIPFIFCDWIKAAAYADWSGLRPMTELEFEKACRGTAIPVLDEFAWGNANLDLSNNLTLSNVDQDNEGIAAGYDAGGSNGNAWLNAGSQTMGTLARVGIFAAHAANSGRVSSGASIWGIMELSGNAWERAVSVGHAEGRKFVGNHGDGELSTNGYANQSSWPGTFGGNEVNSNIGVGYRGAGLVFPTPNLERNARVSSRRLASGFWNATINDDGARFVRSSN